jgi:membrane protein insertase Oxa1/YidC/SpoIIIJ
MGVGVVLYRVSLTVFSFHQTWILSGPLSDDKERGFDPVVAQDVQDPGRVGANWPVVEGEPDDVGCAL